MFVVASRAIVKKIRYREKSVLRYELQIKYTHATIINAFTRHKKKMYRCIDGYEIRMDEIRICQRRNILKSNATIGGSRIYVYRLT